MKTYNEKVMKAIRQGMGLDENDTSRDDKIMGMNKEEVFKEYCQWNGLLGAWYLYVLNAVESIYGISLK